MDLHRIIAVFLVTGMVNAINVTSHGQQSQFEELKHEVEDLSRSLTSALTYIHQKLDGTSVGKQPVAFSACLGSTGPPKTLAPHQPVDFNSVIFNEGGAYNFHQGIFRAPVSGVYHFAVNFMCTPPGDCWLEIVKDGSRLVYTYASGSEHNVGSTEVNIRLDAGQGVWCRSPMTQGHTTLHPEGKYSCFSGHLIS
ncbi:collagen alpha-1(VIII) chain-like [Crassostrea angulata]|uniref:collagen alpha-1(VIII) chain-like n=1 Tax=Magallana angulata TaxID=2784310 RepID=UPI0022B206B2|nr:collagen alpha-1(VIII) chain-like [Crassostrea angulata]